MGRRLLVVTALLMSLGSRAEADPVAPLITDGFVFLFGEGDLHYSFTSPKLSIQHDFKFFPWIGTGLTTGCAAVGCAPGEFFDFDNETLRIAALGTATVHVTPSPGPLSGASLTGHWQFTSPGAFVPTSGADFVSVNAPFAFTGTFNAEWPENVGREPVFARLRGIGTVTVPLQLVGNRYIIEEQSFVHYQFSSPTPEPASLLLLATGVAGVVARKRLTRPSLFR
jgi:PEP-CTERM motif-containing protein